jgi:hypothetical protein
MNTFRNTTIEVSFNGKNISCTKISDVPESAGTSQMINAPFSRILKEVSYRTNKIT